MSRLSCLILLFAVVVTTWAFECFDISQDSTIAGLECIQKTGRIWGIVRCYRSIGSVDPRCATTYNNALAAKIPRVDIYIFPDPHSSKSPETQIDEMMTYLKKENMKPPMIWLDIEGTQYWKDVDFNRDFFNRQVKQLKSYGVRIGIYTSKSQWVPIMGESFTAGSEFPLWYAHYDAVKNFEDFRPFSNWWGSSIQNTHN